MIHVWRLGHKCVENGLCSREMNDYQRRDQTVGYSRTCWQECQSLSLQNITHSNGGNFLRFFKNLLVSLPPWQFSFWNRPVEHQLVGMQAYVSLGTNSSDWHLQTVWLKKKDKNTVQKRECCSAIHLAASGLGPVHCLQCGGGEEGGGDWGLLCIRMNSFSESDPAHINTHLPRSSVSHILQQRGDATRSQI